MEQSADRSVYGSERRQRPMIALLVLAVWLLALAPVAQASQAAQKPPTYSEAIAPILFEHCAPCHRPGGHAPFSLLQYDDARRRAALIAAATTRRAMPPWKPTEPVGAFEGERRLTSAQIDLIARWAAAGAPEGP